MRMHLTCTKVAQEIMIDEEDVKDNERCGCTCTRHALKVMPPIYIHGNQIKYMEYNTTEESKFSARNPLSHDHIQAFSPTMNKSKHDMHLGNSMPAKVISFLPRNALPTTGFLIPLSNILSCINIQKPLINVKGFDYFLVTIISVSYTFSCQMAF